MSVLREDSPLVDHPSFSERAREVVVSCYEELQSTIAHDPRPFFRGLRKVFG